MTNPVARLDIGSHADLPLGGRNRLSPNMDDEVLVMRSIVNTRTTSDLMDLEPVTADGIHDAMSLEILRIFGLNCSVQSTRDHEDLTCRLMDRLSMLFADESCFTLYKYDDRVFVQRW